jgi:hypothetical protein
VIQANWPGESAKAPEATTLIFALLVSDMWSALQTPLTIYRGSLAAVFSNQDVIDSPGRRIHDPSELDPFFHQWMNVLWMNGGGVHGFGIPLWICLIPCIAVAVVSIRRLKKP